MTDVLYVSDTVFEELSASNTDFKRTRRQKFCLVQGGHRIQYSKPGSIFRTRLHVCVAKTRRTMFFRVYGEILGRAIKSIERRSAAVY